MAEAQFRYKSPLRYPSGKQKALKQIVPLLPKRVREYREPMVGGGSVFFAARSLGVAERYWINDLFPDLFHFWQGVQDPATCARLRVELQLGVLSFEEVGGAQEIV
ncbi:MAG: DNA adenine methylase, partial [Armatimonadetes bacterium]|nr:DNA adenine methylase [Armatimonadota bacterium]